jgi:hypothetical protein
LTEPALTRHASENIVRSTNLVEISSISTLKWKNQYDLSKKETRRQIT